MVSAKRKAILIIDIGTSFIKLGLFDEKASPNEEHQSKFEHWMKIEADGTYIFDADQSAQIIERGIDELLFQIDRNKYEIIAVATDTMASTILGIDKSGRAITDVFTYGDTRSHEQLKRIKAMVKQNTFYNDTGCPMHTSYVPSKILWIKEKFPDLYKQVNQWTDFSNYIYRRWLNKADIPMSYSVASWTGMLDRKNLTWHKPTLDTIGINISSLPILKPFSQYVSGLNSSFEKRWDRLASIPFILPVGDGVAANIGMGCNSREKIALSIGTTGALRVLIKDPNPDIPKGLWAYRLGKDYTLLGGAFSEGGNINHWLDRLMNMSSGIELENKLIRSKPDNHGLTVLPFLAGERSIGWADNASGTISGLRLSTTQADIFQAFLESIAYRFELVSRSLLTQLGSNCIVIASGGAVQSSKYWLQLLSDVLGMDVNVSNVREDTGRGTAILTLWALEIVDSIEKFDIEISSSFSPNENKTSIYKDAILRQEQLYSKIFS